MSTTPESFTRSFGRFCLDLAILFELAEAQWLAPEIEELDDPEPNEFAFTTPTIVRGGMPRALTRRMEHLRTDLSMVLTQAAKVTPAPAWFRSDFRAKGRGLLNRLEEAERFLRDAWLNESHQQSALAFYSVSDIPEAFEEASHALLGKSPLATGPWKALVEEFDHLRWSLKSPVAESVQHILTLSMMVYGTRCFQPQICPHNQPVLETDMSVSLQLPPLHLTWSTEESLDSHLRSLIGEANGASHAERRAPYLGIRFDSTNRILRRDGWTESIPLEQQLLRMIFKNLYKLEGALWSLAAIKSKWPGENWSPTAVQKAMSSLRTLISPLSLDVTNERACGYKLVEKGTSQKTSP